MRSAAVLHAQAKEGILIGLDHVHYTHLHVGDVYLPAAEDSSHFPPDTRVRRIKRSYNCDVFKSFS